VSNTNTKPRIIIGSEAERLVLVPRTNGLFFLSPAGLFLWNGSTWTNAAAPGTSPLALASGTLTIPLGGTFVSGPVPVGTTHATLSIQGATPDATLLSLSADVLTTPGQIKIVGGPAPATAAVHVFWVAY